MKILAVSLLRLGDLIMHQEILKQLRSQYPKARLDLVINAEFSKASDLIPQADRIHFFPRQTLQRELVESSGSFFRAFKMMSEWVEKLNLEAYDLVLDLSHTFLSHRLMELLEAKEKVGSRPGYFNDIYSISQQSSFHYLEALRSSLTILDGHTEPAPRTEERKAKLVLVQPYTSDGKKDWSVSAVQRAVGLLAERFSDFEFRLIGAPFEEARLRADFTEASNIKIEILSLAQLQIQLWDAGLLISGDTATIHLAAQCRTPIFGIYLGSADPYQTAPWIEGAYVLQSNVECSPCRHSEKCPQASHLCGESLVPETVVEAISLYLNRQIQDLCFEAGHYPFSVLRQMNNGQKGLVLEDLASVEQTVRNQVRQLAWQQFQKKSEISKVELNTLFLNKFHSQGEDLASHVRDEIFLLEMLMQILAEMQEWLQTLSKALVSNQMREEDQDRFFFENLVRDWVRMSGDTESKALLLELVKSHQNENDFSFYKKARWTIGLILQFTASKKMIYEGLRNLLRERGYHYVTGPGKLS